MKRPILEIRWVYGLSAHAPSYDHRVTRPQSNNVEGEVTGFYIDANGLNHGFLWNPRRLVGNQQ
jgi:hypothetical protein